MHKNKKTVYEQAKISCLGVISWQGAIGDGGVVQPITRRQILESSKLKDFADNNIKFDENRRKLSK